MLPMQITIASFMVPDLAQQQLTNHEVIAYLNSKGWLCDFEVSWLCENWQN